MPARTRVISLFAYSFLLALSVAGAYLLNNRFGYTPMLFLLLLLPADFLCTLFARRSVRRHSASDLQETNRGLPAVFSYTYKNKSRFFVSHMSISLRLTGPGGSLLSKKRALLDLAPQAQKTFQFSVTPRHIGTYQVSTRRIRVHGPVGLFSIRLPSPRPAVLIVTPSRGKISSREPDMENGPNESSTQLNQGDSTSDGYNGVREYAPGDLLRSIHWKLTAHNRKIMTRLYETEEEAHITVAVDLRPAPGTTEQTLFIQDQLYESAYHFVCDRVEQRERVHLLFLKGGIPQTVRIKSEDDLPEAAAELVSAGPSQKALTDEPGMLPESGELLIASAHLDTALARQLSEFSDSGNGSLFLFASPFQFKQQDFCAFFNNLTEHHVEYIVARAAQAGRPQKKLLEIENSTAHKGEKNERIFRG